MRFLDKKLQGWRGISAVLAAILAGLAPANAAPLVLTCAIINEGAWEGEHHYPHEARARAIYAAEAALASIYFPDSKYARNYAELQVQQICASYPNATSTEAVSIIMGNVAQALGAVFPPGPVFLRKLRDLGYPYALLKPGRRPGGNPGLRLLSAVSPYAIGRRFVA